MTPLLEFPFPFLHPGSFWWWDPRPFPGIFLVGLGSDLKKIHPEGGSGCFGSQTRWNSGDVGSSNNDGWSYYFLIRKVGRCSSSSNLDFFFLKGREFERWWIERRSGTDRPQGVPFSIYLQWRVPLADTSILGKFDSCYSNSWHNPWRFFFVTPPSMRRCHR